MANSIATSEFGKKIFKVKPSVNYSNVLSPAVVLQWKVFLLEKEKKARLKISITGILMFMEAL